MGLALNFKNNSDQQLLAQLTADKHNTQWTTAFVHWGAEEPPQPALLVPNHPSHSAAWVLGYWIKGIRSLFSPSPSWSSSSSPASLVSVLSLAICSSTEDVLEGLQSVSYLLQASEESPLGRTFFEG